MRAVVARRGTVGAEDVTDPVPGPGQVLVAPLACGICGSDLHLVDLQAATPDRVPAIVLGHEFVGRVLDTDPQTDPKLVGTTVTSVPYLDTATMDADVVVDPQHTSSYGDWAQLAGPALPPSPFLEEPAQANTVVFECVGAPGVLSSVLESALPHTRVVVVGVCLQPDTIVPAIAITKEISMRFVFAYRPDEFATALRWIGEQTVDVGPLVTGRWTLAAVVDAFGALRQPREHRKILPSPGGEQ